MAQRLTSNPAGSSEGRPRLYLAAADGMRLTSALDETIAPIDGPEAPMEVEFVGLTEEQKQRAISGFPGGSRFLLKQ